MASEKRPAMLHPKHINWKRRFGFRIMVIFMGKNYATRYIKERYRMTWKQIRAFLNDLF